VFTSRGRFVNGEEKLIQLEGRNILKERILYHLKINSFVQKVNMYNVFLIMPCEDISKVLW
jgi:hypothetical protein